MFDQAKTQYDSSASNSDPTQSELDPSLAVAVVAAQAAEDRKAEDILILKVSEVSYLADFFVIATGFSTVQVRAIYQAVLKAVESELDRVPVSIEGQAEGVWTLIDYGDVVIHLLLPEEREFYNLEAFWGHAEKIDHINIEIKATTEP
ncbi:MAG: ribosome silencing factor [Microcoleaceae cyanobacterium]